MPINEDLNHYRCIKGHRYRLDQLRWSGWLSYKWKAIILPEDLPEDAATAGYAISQCFEEVGADEGQLGLGPINSLTIHEYIGPTVDAKGNPLEPLFRPRIDLHAYSEDMEDVLSLTLHGQDDVMTVLRELVLICRAHGLELSDYAAQAEKDIDDAIANDNPNAPELPSGSFEQLDHSEYELFEHLIQHPDIALFNLRSRDTEDAEEAYEDDDD